MTTAIQLLVLGFPHLSRPRFSILIRNLVYGVVAAAVAANDESHKQIKLTNFTFIILHGLNAN